MNQRWKVILVFTGVFLAGAVCGGPVAARLLRTGRSEWRPGNMRLQVMERLEHELKLTDAQKERVRPLVLRAQEETQHMRRENIRNIAIVMDRMHAEISAELTPEQRIKLEEMRKRFRERAERVRGEFREQDRPERS
jgi:Spy/CpxP family protein refolding chaperone